MTPWQKFCPSEKVDLMRMIKGLLFAVVVLAVLLGGAAAYVANTDLENVRSAVQEHVRERTGRELEIGGEIDLTLALAPTVTVAGVSLGNAEWASYPAMAKVGRLQVKLRLVPLIFGDLEIDRVELQDVQVFLETDRTGRGNWVFDGLAGDTSNDGDTTSLPLAQVVAIRDIQIIQRDGRNGSENVYTASVLDLAAEDFSGPLVSHIVAEIDGEALELDGSIPALRGLISGDGGRLDLAGSFDARKVEVSGNLSLSKDKAGGIAGIRLSDLTADYDGVTAKGDATATFGAERPFVIADLALGSIDTTKLSKMSPAGPDLNGLDIPIPFELLSKFDGQFKLTISQVSTPKMELRDVQAEGSVKDGILTLTPSSAVLADGAVAVKGTIGARGNTGDIALKGSWIQGDLGKLLMRMTNTAELEARGDAAFDVTGRGTTGREIRNSLSGVANYVAKEGSIANATWEWLAADLVSQFVPFVGQDAGQGVLTCMAGRVEAKAGVLDAKVMYIETSRVSIAGSGKIDMPDEKLNLRLTPRPKDASLVSLATPVLIQGSFDEPVFVPDPLAVATTAGTMAIGTVALGAVNPLFLLIPLMSSGADVDACAVAVDAANGKTPKGGTKSSGGIMSIFDGLKKIVE
ncbi:MAG: AsmA family protein [Rhodospirillaceae bacterium]|jgi:AsmA family protein|nr:AsmA family protein [Rhodospirillaceae bacterium]MBT6137039.1 AsmA family protein [Rhodospirillaceae bacterium]